MTSPKFCGRQNQLVNRRRLPVLPRTEDTLQSGILKKKACRCLFGPIDRQEVKNLLANFQAAIAKEKNARWNFDFENGRPLPGDISWTPVEDESSHLISLSGNVSQKPTKSAPLRKSVSGKQTSLNDFFRQQKTNPPALPEKRKSMEGASFNSAPKLTKFTVGKK